MNKPKELTELENSLGTFDAPWESDLSPQELAEQIGRTVAKAVERTGLMVIVEVKVSLGKVHFLGRVTDENKKSFIQDFSKAVWAKTIAAGVDVFVGTQYFPYKGDVNNIKYGWVFAFSSEDLEEAAKAICSAADEVQPKVEVMESPLVGPATPSGGRGRGKGAAPVRVG
jgi:hypothetical protein